MEAIVCEQYTNGDLFKNRFELDPFAINLCLSLVYVDHWTCSDMFTIFSRHDIVCVCVCVYLRVSLCMYVHVAGCVEFVITQVIQYSTQFSLN